MLFKMGNKASVHDVVTKAYQADRDEGSDQPPLDLLKYLNAESRKAALETKIKDGDDLATPLIVAARDGKLDVVKYLLRYEANSEGRGTIKINGEVIEDCTALWVAAAKGHFDVVRLLIEQNAEVDCRTSTNSTPLRAAVFHGHLDIVRCLVENGADVNSRTNFGSTPLMITCYKGYPNVASYLVKHGANINLQDYMGGSCLHYASEGGRVQLACELPALGAKQTLADRKKYELSVDLWTQSMEIAMNCNVPKTEELESLTDLVSEMVKNGHSLSSQTIENIFEKLTDIKRQPSEKLKSGELEEEQKNEAQETLLFNALYLLVMYTKVQVSSEMKNGNMIDLLRRFLCLEPRTRDGNTLLHLAAWHKTPVPRDIEANWRGVCELPCVVTMKLILHAGCDVNSVNAQGNTPLHLAVTFVPEPEQVEILKEMLELLLDLGADTKLVDKNGQTVMDYCETDEARCILSAKGRLVAMNIEARKVRKVRFLTFCIFSLHYHGKRPIEMGEYLVPISIGSCVDFVSLRLVTSLIFS